MNKKVKKRLQLLHQRIQKLNLQLSGARQGKEPEEISRIEKEIAAANQEIQKLKEG